MSGAPRNMPNCWESKSDFQKAKPSSLVGGYLHDVGKVGIPNSILRKQGSLTNEEFNM